MRPRETRYLLATEPAHFAQCRQVWREAVVRAPELGPVRRFGWPTVFAERNGTVVGFLTTHRHPKVGPIAGPLVLASQGTPITVLRLVEAYEVVLRVAGVDSYIFAIVTPELQRALDRLDHQALGLERCLDTGEAVWYKKKVGGFPYDNQNLGRHE